MELLLLLLLFQILNCECLTVRDLRFTKWINYKMHFKKNYLSPTEDTFRAKIWMTNRKMIAEHNQLFAEGKVSYKMGINQFSDMMTSEFFSQFSHTINDETSDDASFKMRGFSPKTKDVPKEFDWRTKGAITKVKNQYEYGKCGSCYSFTATAAIESHNFIKTGKLIPLSEQQIIDCSTNDKYKNRGCQGGKISQSFQYIIDQGGLDTEKSYPYEGNKSKSCRYDPRNVGAKIQSFTKLPQNEKDLKNAVFLKGPVAVTIKVTSKFKEYKEGVFDDPSCTPDKTTHAILVIGYGSIPKYGKYWLIKNSWVRKQNI